MKRIAIIVTVVLMVVTAVAIAMSRREKARARAYKEYATIVRSLVGKRQAIAHKSMQRLGMTLRSTYGNKKEWRAAIDHVSPSPPETPHGHVFLKYTDVAMLTRKCAFLYVDANNRISTVFLTAEYW